MTMPNRQTTLHRRLPQTPSAANTFFRAARNFRRKGEDNDPLLGLVNLFDASMVLVVAMLVSLSSKSSLADVAARLSQQDVTIITNPGKADMEMVIKRGQKIEKLKSTGETGRGAGSRLGTAYRLESGEVVYVPESGTDSGVAVPAPGSSPNPKAK